jgi:hypothetical protein
MADFNKLEYMVQQVVKRDLGVKIYAPITFPGAKRGELRWEARIWESKERIASTARLITVAKYGLQSPWIEPQPDHPEHYLVKVKPVLAQYRKKNNRKEKHTNDATNDAEDQD